MKEYKVKVFDTRVEWYFEGKFHREDGPAIEYVNGEKYWYKNGEFHREDGPAVEYSNGTKCWFKNDLRHREDGPAIEYADGYKAWYVNGKLHREDGPAVEFADDYKEWWLSGTLHGVNDDFTNNSWYENNHLTKAESEKTVKAEVALTCENKYVEVDGIKYKLVKI